MSILITGITGFVGSHLADYLLEETDEKIYGLTRWRSPKENVLHLVDNSRVEFVYGDMTDFASLFNIINLHRPRIIFHLAAQSVIEDEFIPILKSKNMDVYTFKELWETCSKNNNIEIVCNDGIETEIINIDSLQIRAISFFSGMGQWVSIKQISRHKYSGEIVELKQKYGSIRVTPNHCVIDKNYNLCSPLDNPEILPMRKLNYYNKKIVTKLSLKRSRKYEKNDDYFYIGNVPNKKLPVILSNDKLEAFAFFCAAYIAEGCAHSRIKKRNFITTISNGDKKWLEERQKELKCFSEGLEGKYAINKKKGYKNVFNLVITSELLYDMIVEYCGKGSKFKKIPSFVFKMSKQIQSKFLKILVEGDGCIEYRKNYETIRYTTSSRRLSAQICLLLTLLNKDYTVHESKDVFFIRECKFYQPNQGVNKNKVVKSSYDGYVYDISVGGSEIFAVGVGNLMVHNSYVPYSFEVPAATLDSNVLGTCNLLESIKTIKDDEGYDPVVHICSCYDEQTEVLTENGFKKYRDIKKDDKVVSFNPVTHKIELKPIKKIIIQEYCGEMYHIKTRSVDLCITPNHNLIYSSDRENDHFKFGNIEDINKFPNKRYYFPKGSYEGSKEDVIKIGKETYDIRDIFYLMGIYIGDGYSDHLIKHVKNKSGYGRKDFLKECRNGGGRFCNTLLIGKGERTLTRCNSYRIFLAIPKEDKSRQRVEECLNRLRISFKSYKNDSYIYFSSKSFFNFFDEVGHAAFDKHIPQWIFNYDADLLDYLYKGLIDSDGYYHKSGERYTTVSELLSYDFIKLCLFTNRFVTVSKRKASKSIIEGRTINSSPSFCFSISGKNRMIENKNVKKIDYNGKIWCLEIEDNHNFAVKRNGKINFCGNSSEVYGQVSEDNVPITEDCPFAPASPYAVSKVGEDMLGYQYWTSWGIKTIRTRMFSHTGPRRGDVFVVSAFAKQIAKIEAGLQPAVIHVGNLDSVRTFADARDTVKAYWQLVNKCEPGEVYNIGGNVTMTIGQMLDRLIEKSTRDNIEIFVDPNLLRPSDVTLQIPCVDKFKKVTGWEPEIDFDTTLEDTLNFWREYWRKNG